MSEDEISTLKNLLNDNIIISTSNGHESNTIHISLDETNASPPYQITMINVPANHILIKLDNYQGQSALFNGSHNECKCADYCLITISPINGTKIVYIELKRGNSRKKVISQLKGTKCLIEYFKAIVNEFLGDSDFLKNFQEHYVCISSINSNMNKRPTVSKTVDNSMPDKYLLIEGSTQIHFNRCIQKLYA